MYILFIHAYDDHTANVQVVGVCFVSQRIPHGRSQSFSLTEQRDEYSTARPLNGGFEM